MLSGLDFTQRLHHALQETNAVCSKKGYTVTATNEHIDPKKPIFLSLSYNDGKVRPIGVVHLVRLEGVNWDATPAEALAKSAHEIAQAILARIKLFLETEEKLRSSNGRLYIDERGTIFDFNGVDVTLEKDHTFSINGEKVILGDRALPINRLVSEGVITFTPTEDGETELIDASDHRAKKRALIDQDGNFYRK